MNRLSHSDSVQAQWDNADRAERRARFEEVDTEPSKEVKPAPSGYKLRRENPHYEADLGDHPWNQYYLEEGA